MQNVITMFLFREMHTFWIVYLLHLLIYLLIIMFGLALCIMCNASYLLLSDDFFLSNLIFSKQTFRNVIRESNGLDPDQV